MELDTGLSSPWAEFDGRTALVTGGSDGLGRHLVLALTALGARVFFCGRDTRRGRDVQVASGNRAQFILCDVTHPEEIAALIEAAASTGRIDYLVNNAAVDPRIQFSEAAMEDFDRLVAVNLRGPFNVTQAALPYLRRGVGKAIVNIGTTNWMLGSAPFTIYAASKSGLLGFTRALARELGPLAIRVNMVSPGWIMTSRQLREYVNEQIKEKLLSDQCLKFLLIEKHITPVTLFLLSAWSGAMSGQNLIVDGGKLFQ
jgi:NAD(P)-dependent dehydrogenase (short-subunit alcohol dehydrogenase family)